MSKSYWLQFGTGDPASFTGLSPTLTLFSANGITAITAPGITEIPSGGGLYRFIYGPTLPMIFKADGGATLSAANRYLAGVLDPIDAVNETTDTINTNVGVANSGIIGVSAIVSATGSTLGFVSTNVSAGLSGIFGLSAPIAALGSTQTLIATNIGIGLSGIALGNTSIAGVSMVVAATGTTLLAMGATMGGMASLVGTVSDSFGSTSIDPSTLFGYLKRSLEYWEGNSIYTKATGVWQLFSRGSSTLLNSKTLTNTNTTATKN